ncbi:MAG: hypothetical protein PHD13_05905 [Methanocellales archaeon]|nr:hypothetical protein [Methanocellales archaeon]MDD3292027.1 hypothetical protein [Methanocellales archaeon]MDD5235690.1 hypothetical protein [Methanocellales archaeon]MDD5485616.1 hypothetical protein [Methanocellales archaeon]
MAGKKRLRILLEHNIEHNKSHINKLREIAEEGRELKILNELELAIDYAEKSNNKLEIALEKIKSS